MTLRTSRCVSLSLAAMIVFTPIAAAAEISAPLSDAARHHARREALAMSQGPRGPITVRIQQRAPALLPILIGAGAGCGFGLWVGRRLEGGAKLGWCGGLALAGTVIGATISML